jgi:hypothetical protein
MDAQAISNATAKNGLAGLAISGGPQPPRDWRSRGHQLARKKGSRRAGRRDEQRPSVSPAGGSGNHDQVAQSYRETST